MSTSIVETAWSPVFRDMYGDVDYVAKYLGTHSSVYAAVTDFIWRDGRYEHWYVNRSFESMFLQFITVIDGRRY